MHSRATKRLSNRVKSRPRSSTTVSARTGRSRLPPAKREYRMASASGGGQAFRFSNFLARIESILAFWASINSAAIMAKVPPGLRLVHFERPDGGAVLGALGEDLFEFGFGRREFFFADFDEFHSLFVEFDRFFEARAFGFETLDDLVQPFDRFLKFQFTFGHVVPSAPGDPAPPGGRPSRQAL